MACVEIARGSVVVSSASVTATYSGSNITGGHIIVVAGENDNDIATCTVSDTDSNTFTLDVSQVNGASNSSGIFSAANAGTINNSHVFTFTPPVNASRMGLIVYHVDNLDGAALLDEIGNDSGSSTTPASTLDATTTNASTLVMGGGMINSDGSLGWTPSGGDGDVLDITNRSVITSFTYETSAGTHNEGGTADATGIWSFAVAAYKVTSAGAYSLDCQPGAFTLTGVAATLARGLFINAATGSFAITGVAATTARGLFLDSQPGLFTLTGVAATLVADRVIDAQPASYTLTGTAAELVLVQSTGNHPELRTLRSNQRLH